MLFKILVKFFKIMIIACLIGVGLKVIDIITIQREKTIAKIDNKEIIAIDVGVCDKKEEKEKPIADRIENNVEEKVEKKLQKEVEINTTKIEVNQERKNSIEVSKEEQELQMNRKEKQKDIDENKKQESEKVKETKEDDEIEKQEQNKMEEQKQEVKEEYKRNDKMIAKIEEIIKDNETEDMKEFGYEILPDKTIPEATNEFTFSEKRVKDKLKFKSGTIRIYARDYYYNGNYVSTQCFII